MKFVIGKTGSKLNTFQTIREKTDEEIHRFFLCGREQSELFRA